MQWCWGLSQGGVMAEWQSSAVVLVVVSVLQPLRTPWAHHLDMPHPATATRDLNHIHLVWVVPLLYHLASNQGHCPMAALRYSVCVCVYAV